MSTPPDNDERADTSVRPHEGARIGLEVHVRLATATKLLSAAPNLDPVDEVPPNSAVDAWSIGAPGTLPSLDADAVRLAVRAALAFEATVAPVSRFERKHYAYPDLPKAFQITQRASPLATGGHVELDALDGAATHRIALRGLHIEEDAAATAYDGDTIVLDFNRAGVPLVEVVTEPTITSPDQAAAVAREIRDVLVAAGVTHGRMEHGHLRVDANVSIAGGPRVEIKNLASFAAIRSATAYELRRLAAADPADLVAETRGWDADSGTTYRQRLKQDPRGYAMLPEPDLPPLRIDGACIDAERAALPTLPATSRRRLRALGLRPRHAARIAADTHLLATFDTLSRASDAGTAAAWLLGPVSAALNDGRLVRAGTALARAGRADTATAADTAADTAALGRLVDLAASLTTPAGRRLFELWLDTGTDPQTLVDAHDLRAERAPDTAELVDRVLAAHPNEAARLRAGDARLVDVLLGAALRAAGGRADPAALKEALTRLIDTPTP